ncbi:hypothetical protein STENM327S_00744 [Streptomyces tendae]
MYSTLLTKLGLPHLPPAVAWSPDSSLVLTHRTVQDGVRRTHLLRAAPAGGGESALLSPRYAVAGDEHIPLAEFVVLDVTTGAVTEARGEPVAMSMMSPLFQRWAWWAPDGSAVHYLSRSRDARTLGLYRLDPDTGEVRTVLTERGRTRVDPAPRQLQPPLVRVLAGGEQVLWYSERDGRGHLYLHAASTGALVNAVTSGSFAVQELLHVDEAEGTVYLTASGLVEEDPYRRTVCRVGLDGSGFERITDDDLDHAVTVAPGGTCFVDSASTTAAAPVITVRDWSGRVLVELERADDTRLKETGWRAPIRFRTTSADGSCDVYGLLHLPHDFDPARRYPVIDTPYGLPTDNRVSPSFDPGHYGYEAQALAALGFVVVAVDGKGTFSGRSKEFLDASYGNLGDACGLDDHVAALRQLAADRPWMDLDRVGVTGMSSGGYAAVRALLRHPDVFRVGVAESGMHDFRLLEPGLGEAYHGPFDEEEYAALANESLADRLEGSLLLVHGGLDYLGAPAVHASARRAADRPRQGLRPAPGARRRPHLLRLRALREPAQVGLPGPAPAGRGAARGLPAAAGADRHGGTGRAVRLRPPAATTRVKRCPCPGGIPRHGHLSHAFAGQAGEAGGSAHQRRQGLLGPPLPRQRADVPEHLVRGAEVVAGLLGAAQAPAHLGEDQPDPAGRHRAPALLRGLQRVRQGGPGLLRVPLAEPGLAEAEQRVGEAHRVGLLLDDPHRAQERLLGLSPRLPRARWACPSRCSAWARFRVSDPRLSPRRTASRA